MVRTIARIVASILFITGCCTHDAYATPVPAEFQSAAFEDILTPRRPIPVGILGVNSFANDQRFGSIRSQYQEVRSTLKLKQVRILFAWNDQVQPTPSATPFFGFYDELARSLPPRSEALVVLTGVPSWMNDSRNWIDGNPRKTFVEMWVKKVAARYKRRTRLRSFQIWNEPNNPSFTENQTLQVLTSPENYVELLALGHAAVKAIAPRKRVINGATTAIAQNYPSTLDYNKAMVRAGALAFTDAYAIHFYGKSVERVLFPGGVRDFVRGLAKKVWITETGQQGIFKQVEYAERILPFLKNQMPSITRMYWYQHTEATPAQSTYGLRNLTPGLTVSDLYIKLRDRASR